ncbi:MAG: co-chaperone GroES [Candidatus Aminicenantes bacterium]|nr:MAG: co-chaperone GroES [Candidatus Aminicenantes bacterium]
MKITPLYDRVLLERLEEPPPADSKIVIPDSAKEPPLQAEVIAVGEGRWERGRLVPLLLKKGDIVLIGKFAGTDIMIAGEEYVIVREEEIFCKISRR